jgi:hypothetical protein
MLYELDSLRIGPPTIRSPKSWLQTYPRLRPIAKTAQPGPNVPELTKMTNLRKRGQPSMADAGINTGTR